MDCKIAALEAFYLSICYTLVYQRMVYVPKGYEYFRHTSVMKGTTRVAFTTRPSHTY
ncbi:MAG: hypothetical protein QNJ51_09795 [Calothrix sp. MO_167.B12]|nr:hypothetical protein [Calothrix sp. MO_167.B12]